MTKKEAHSLVIRIKYASYTEAVKLIMKELDIKPKNYWLKPERN